MKTANNLRLEGLRASYRRLGASVAILCLSGCGYAGFASLNDSNQQANDDSENPSLSSDARYVAFQSFADNLVPNSSSTTQHVYSRDISTETTSIASVSSAQVKGNGNSYFPIISRNGRYVAFESLASNLVFNDTNGERDIFLHDTTTGNTQRLNQFGFLPVVQANGFSGNVDIACTAGCRAVFESDATNLVGNDFNGLRDVFTWVAGGIERVSVDKDGNDADGESRSAAAALGGIIAYQSAATNLLDFGTDNNGFNDIYVRNTALDQNSRVSVNWLGGDTNGNSRNPDVDATGQYVVFQSEASDLIFGDTNNFDSIYLRDRFNFFTEKISVSTAGVSGNLESTDPQISDDGRYVVFRSFANNLVPNDTNGEADIFVRDRWKDTTTRVSVDTFGVEANDDSRHPTLSGNGRYAAFSSSARNLVPNDTNDVLIGGILWINGDDVVVRFVPEITVTAIVPNILPSGETTPVTVSGSNFLSGSLGDISGSDDTISNLVIVDESTLTMDVTLSAGATLGARSVSVLLPGNSAGAEKGGLGTCTDCATVVAGP